MSKDLKVSKLLSRMITDAEDLQLLCDTLKNRFHIFDEFDDLDELMEEIIKVEKDFRLCLTKLKKEV